MKITEYDGGSLIEVWLQPRASKSRIVGRHERGFKVAVCSPPVENRANEELIKLISSVVDLPRSRVSIKSGAKGRSKLVYVEGVPPTVVQEAIERAIEG